MAYTTTSPQIPQHVSALLSHLTSRPGVQSTLILSRKDGSIIQTTGLLAPPKPTRSESSSPAPVGASSGGEDATAVTETGTATDAATSPATEAQSPTTATSSAQTQTQTKPYQPTQAEALAAHIFSFVASASSLSFSLSHPAGEGPQSNGINGTVLSNGSGAPNGSIPGRDDNENDASEGQDDDEVKLLRLRTKKHEIVVVPDRKYLLCVVQDATSGAGTAASGGAGLATGGRFSK